MKAKTDALDNDAQRSPSAALLGAMLGTLGSTVIVLITNLGQDLVKTASQIMNIDTAVKLLLLQGCALVIAAAVIWRQRERLRQTNAPLACQYEFLPDRGCYLDHRNGQALCPACLSDNKLIHMLDTGGAHMCMACRTACPKPDRKTRP